MSTIAEEHPELFHYTNINGLIGILKSQTLWATHYAFKNDSEEVQFFIDKELPNLLQKAAQKYLKEQDKKNSDVLLENEKYIIDDFIEKTLASYKQILFSNSRGKEPLAEPYIFSFSSVKNTSESVRLNGRLSQWRGYGQQEGGYAIVFDTEKLSVLFNEAGEKWLNGVDPFFIGDVVYSSASESKFYAEFEEDLSVISKYHLDHLSNTKDPAVLEKYFSALMKCACRYKHEGFEEENEVRVVAVPVGKQISELMKNNGEIVYQIPIKHLQRSGTAIPYIDLFEDITTFPEKPLPIKRIIVGPGANTVEKNKKTLAIRKLTQQLGINVEVSTSEIPYLG